MSSVALLEFALAYSKQSNTGGVLRTVMEMVVVEKGVVHACRTSYFVQAHIMRPSCLLATSRMFKVR